LPSDERGYLLGALGLWVGTFFGYCLGHDFYTNPTVEIPIAMAIIDRIGVFAKKGLVPVKGKMSS
jgi:hypothetical protein